MRRTRMESSWSAEAGRESSNEIRNTNIARIKESLRHRAKSNAVNHEIKTFDYKLRSSIFCLARSFCLSVGPSLLRAKIKFYRIPDEHRKCVNPNRPWRQDRAGRTIACNFVSERKWGKSASPTCRLFISTFVTLNLSLVAKKFFFRSLFATLCYGLWSGSSRENKYGKRPNKVI